MIEPPEGAITFDIDQPPSINMAFTNVPGKGRVRTQLLRSWAKTTGQELVFVQRIKPLSCGPYAIDIRMPERSMDIDNGLKAILDLLKPGKHGIGLTPDDRWAWDLRVRRDPTIESGLCSVTIWSLQ